MPFRTPQGWLEIYHGADKDNRYCLGAVLLDGDDPSCLLARSAKPLLIPEAPYELTGLLGNVVFTCGAVPEDDGTLKLYWGGADKVMCAGTAVIDELVELCLTDSRPPM